MTPVTPEVFEGARMVTYAANQPPYIPLTAAVYPDGLASTKWRLSWRERFRILFGAHVYLRILTFNYPLQPVKLDVEGGL